MELYLMRHGEATSADEDDSARSLTDVGRAGVERVARRAAAAGVRLTLVQHSGILRARLTAELLAQYLAPNQPAQSRAGLQPLDPVDSVVRWLEEQQANTFSVALVGHLPSLDRLVSRLVAGDEHVPLLTFRPAALLKLVPRQERGGFAIQWLLDPDLA
jgi:phosphohistidine phosphatase